MNRWLVHNIIFDIIMFITLVRLDVDWVVGLTLSLAYVGGCYASRKYGETRQNRKAVRVH